MSQAQKEIKITPEPYIKKQYVDGELIILPDQLGEVKFMHVTIEGEIKIDMLVDEDEVRISIVKWYNDNNAEIFDYKFKLERSVGAIPWYVYDICEYRHYLLQSSARELVARLLQELEDNVDDVMRHYRKTDEETGNNN